MNTANLQFEGLLLAIAALCTELKSKGILDDVEIERLLGRAEAGSSDRDTPLSGANAAAVLFPIRFLRLACQGDGRNLDFQAIAAQIGRLKDDATLDSAFQNRQS